MSESVVAYRYAKALIDFAIEQKVVEEVSADMTYFLDVCKADREFMAVMANPIVRHDDKSKILNKIFKNNVNKVTFSIFDVLTRKNREKLIYPIAIEFNKLYNELNKIEIATVISVEELTDDQRSEFLKIVKDATGKTVKLVEKIDANLIGGYVLKVGDTQIDTSIRKRLNELKLELA
ncbi:ATP synthase F1 subcomplex delta subunit [Spirosomataceae bacterium TFI 002]|nr:ATP synthase F1 subcomplex delta subunit [Spirosomataceae bacterium TFI 002]